MSIMQNCPYTSFLLESLQLYAFIRDEDKVNCILPYIFPLSTLSLVAIQLRDTDIWEQHSNRKD